jgi:cyanophycin synthetase
VVLATGMDQTSVLDLGSITFSDSVQRPFATENILAAVGAAWALGITGDLIRAGIQTFDFAHAAH